MQNSFLQASKELGFVFGVLGFVIKELRQSDCEYASSDVSSLVNGYLS